MYCWCVDYKVGSLFNKYFEYFLFVRNCLVVRNEIIIKIDKIFYF